LSRGDCHKGICENGGEQSVFEEAKDSCIEGKLDHNPQTAFPASSVAFRNDQGLQWKRTPSINMAKLTTSRVRARPLLAKYQISQIGRL